MSKLKVGARVKQALFEEKINFLEHWNSYWSYKHGESDGTFYITRDLGGNYYSYSNKPNGDGPQAPEKYFELVEETPMSTPEYSCIRVVPPSKPKREIVEGEVRFDCGASFNISDGGDNDCIVEVEGSFFTPKALREAAALFTTLAEVLEENSNA